MLWGDDFDSCNRILVRDVEQNQYNMHRAMYVCITD